MMFLVKLAAAAFITVFFINSSFAEIIKLKNGKTIDAKIIKKSDDKIEVDISGIPVTYYAGEVQTINGNPAVVKKTEETEVEKVALPNLAIEIKKEAYYLDPQTEETINTGVTAIYESYQKEFGFEYPEIFVAKVHIFDTQDLFERYQKNILGKLISHTGFYSTASQEAVVWKNINTSTMISVILHETSHLFLHSYLQIVPVWLDEGLAEFFEGIYFGESGVSVVFSREADAWCRHKAKYEKDFDVKNYLKMSNDEWDKINENSGDRAYDINLSMVYFLMSNRERRAILKDIINYLAENPEATDASIKAFDSYYPGGANQFSRDWRAFAIEPRKTISLFLDQ